MEIGLFLTRLEMILREQVKDNYPNYWDEDFITLSILKELGKTLKVASIEGLKRRMKIEWKIFKLRGRNENKFGDIAILVNINYHDGDVVEGVAFLEAKKRSISSVEFGAMQSDQIKRICSNAPRSTALLYDYEDVTQFAHIDMEPSRWEWYEWKPCTCSVVVPLNIIEILGKKDTTLYKFSLPFSYELFFRYFQGFDLEFGQDLINVAKGYIKDKGIPTYLVIASIAFGRAEPSKDISYNAEYFGPIE